ncbi:MAG: ABC transporter ATP-binding protein [Alphaproteobacteria bacterium]
MTRVVFESVTKTYDTVRAVDDISITMESGAFTTILGPSGSGKTTMLSLIAGITEPSDGQIWLDNTNVTRIPAAERNIGLVFQSYALFPHMTVFDNVAFPLKLRNVSSAEIASRVDHALDLVRLTGYARRKPRQLSGGQQQRVALARAIVFEPSILLLDEPLAALDRNLREDVRIELRELQRTLGITTIMVTHDQDEALSLSDSVILLSDGAVQQIGAPSELYHQPANRFAAEFLGTATFLEGTWTGGQVRTNGGALLPCACRGFREGDSLCGVLRPNAIGLSPSPPGIAGTITDVDFLGEAVRYSAVIDDGPTVHALVVDQRTNFALDDRVYVSWNPENVWILPDCRSSQLSGAEPNAER